jgi:Phage terminase large subunit gpA, ATPase domain
MNDLALDFITGLKARVDPTSSTLVYFLTEKTYLNGKKFSFLNHEYQEFLTELIQDNPGFTFVWKKPSQIGLSELANRIILSRMALRPGEGVLISFPSKAFSQEVIKTRIADAISESPALRDLQDKEVDSASVKKFLNNSILYGLSGSKGTSSLLNRPIATCMIDEVDRQDVDVYSGFRSRQTHTAPEDRLNLLISTPTAPSVGIDAEFDDCNVQYSAMLRCDCGHEFDPDYYKDVHIPGYNDSLKLLTKTKAAALDLTAAYLECPGCGCHLTTRNSEVFYDKKINPLGTKKRIGVALTPFVAMSFISIPDLVESSITYTSHVEFLNQGLGKTATLKDSSIPVGHIHFIPDESRGMRVIGLDMGKMCAFMSGVVRGDTTIFIDTIEYLKLSEIEKFFTAFMAEFPTVAAVMDSMPYTDLVYRMVRKFPRLFSSIYSDPVPQPPELYKLKMTDKHGELVRQVNITKNKMMGMMANSMDDFISFAPTPYNDIVVDHITSMRKVRDYRYQEMIYRWVKPKDGQDHFFHATTYLYTASKLALADLALGGGTAPIVIHKINPDKLRAKRR